MSTVRQPYFEIIFAGIVGILAALILSITLSFPAKYVMTFTLGLIATPILLTIRNKEQFFIGAFLLSLPLTMGLKIMQRLDPTYSSMPFLLQIYLSDVFLVLFFFSWFFKSFASRYNAQYSIWRNKMVIPLILWFGMGFLSLIPAIDRTVVFVEIVRMARVFLTFFCVFQFVKGRKEIHFILNCLLLALFLQALLMFAQHATNSLVIQFSGSSMEFDIVEQGSRPTGTMMHSSNFAKFSGLVLPIVLAYVFFTPKIKGKLLSLLIWACGSIALVLTISRVGIATWLLSIVLFFIGIIKLHIMSVRRMVPLFMTCMLLMVVSAGIIYLAGGEQLKGRMEYDEGSAGSRIPMWKVALNIIKTHPITGVGLRNYTLVHQNYDHTQERISLKLPFQPVHSLFLLYAAEIGIPGLLFFLWFIWKLLRGALQCVSHTDVAIDKAIYLSIAIGVISILLQSITGKGVTSHLIHLSIIAIFAACIAKQCSILNDYQGKNLNLSHTKH